MSGKKSSFKEHLIDLGVVLGDNPNAYELAMAVWYLYQDDIYDNPEYKRKPVPKFMEWCQEKIIELRFNNGNGND